MSSRITSLSLLLGLASAGFADDSFQPAPITVPKGFSVEVAAAPPLVRHPMMAGFDDRGRLYVAESAGMNLRRDDLEKQLPNFVRRLEDTDGDGRFDKSTIFADQLTLPQGALWHAGALFVAAPPYIWRLEDTDDDGVADKREVLVSSFGYTGNAASIHGCFLGPTGRIFWCDGRHGHDHESADGQTKSSGKAARIFSSLPDGSDFRVHCGGGMDNPVEIDFTPEGEMLGTVNLFYRKRGDCLVHWMHGGVYPRHDQPAVVAEFPRTGDLLTEVVNLGHVAVSGTTRYRGNHMGAGFRDNFFITEFNTHKVVRAVLERNGSTFRSHKQEFLASTSDDFHPTDVLEDADGSLLVIDTGGWFRIGCPTSQIAKPNILGAIYRIRRDGGTTSANPRGSDVDWSASSADLAALISDERFAVREEAIATLARRGDAATDAVADKLNDAEAAVRRRAVFALARIGTPDAIGHVRLALDDRHAGVRQAAAYCAGDLRDTRSVANLIERLRDEHPAVVRQAATALGQIKNREAVSALLDALQQGVDRVLEHALIYALIEIDAPRETAAGLAMPNPRVQRAALIALDQMHSGELTREMVSPLLDTEDSFLQAAALEVVGRHPAWSKETGALLARLLAEPTIAAERRAMVRGALYAFRSDKGIQRLVATRLADRKVSSATKRLLLEAIARSGLRPPPDAWLDSVKQTLSSDDRDVLFQAVTTAEAINSPRLTVSLMQLAENESQPVSLRVSALGAVAHRSSQLSNAMFQLLIEQLNAEVPPMQRLAAARAVGNALLSVKQRLVLADRVAEAGPLELAPLLTAFEKTGDANVGRRLVVALSKSIGASSLSAEHVQRLLKKYPDNVHTAALPLLEKLRSTHSQQQARLAELAPLLAGGDPEAGRRVFFSKQASCFACHRIANEGGRVGPDLSTIGQSRSTRDLLEAVVYPSASLVRGFESYALTTDEGKVYTGLIVRESADLLQLRTAQQQEIHLPRDSIEEMLPSRQSIMPAGLEKTMTTAQLRDLLAFLASLKAPRPQKESP